MTEWTERLTRHIPPKQFVRYLLVGVWNTLFGYTTFAILVAILTRRMAHQYVAYTTAQVLSSIINITVAYFGYKFFVFKTRGNYLSEWLKCLAVYGVSSTLPGLFILPVLVLVIRKTLHLYGSAPYIAGALLTGVGAILSFLGNRNFSFRSGTMKPAE